MIVLSANNLAKSYGIDTVLDDISFILNHKDKVGLIGLNGAGKTTLLNILAGKITSDQGTIFMPSGTTIGYLQQNGNFNSEGTVYEELLSIFSDLLQMETNLRELELEIAHLSEKGEDTTLIMEQYAVLSDAYKDQNGYGYKSEILGILNSLGFSKEYLTTKVAALSGGEKTRLSLASLLLKKPSLLLLDEPTNHLDIETLRWLEQYLKNYQGTVVIISHDRYFLDQIVGRTFEVENKKLFIYECNYTEHIRRKKEREDAELKNYEKQQKEIEKQEEIIRRFKQHGTEKLANRAKSREKKLDALESVDRPTIINDKIKIHFKESIASGRDVLSGQDIQKSFGSKLLFSNVSLEIKRGEKVCLVGPNGIGKTTLLKIILQETPADFGIIKHGHNTILGYYDQEQKLLTPSNTVLEEMHSAYRLYTETELRNILGRFLFKGDDVYKNISSLSGGEKARLSLLKIMLSGSNFLILDEPTNHLDISSKEVFEDALLDFPGTLFMVSHDRYFLNKTATRILEFTPEGLIEYLGNYDDYVEKKTQLAEDAMPQPDVLPTKTKLKEDRKKEKEQQNLHRKTKKEKNDLEVSIAQLEENIEKTHQKMCLEEVFSSQNLMQECTRQLKIFESDLSLAYERWMNLHS